VAQLGYEIVLVRYEEAVQSREVSLARRSLDFDRQTVPSEGAAFVAPYVEPVRRIVRLAVLPLLAACSSGALPSGQRTATFVPQVRAAAYCQGSSKIRVHPCPVTLKNVRGVVVTVSGPHVKFVKPGAGCSDVCSFRKVIDTKWRVLPGLFCGSIEAQFTALNPAKRRIGVAYLRVTNRYCEATPSTISVRKSRRRQTIGGAFSEQRTVASSQR
jgi:hypothetical protein